MKKNRVITIVALVLFWIVSIAVTFFITRDFTESVENPLSKFNLISNMGKEDFSELVKIEVTEEAKYVYHYSDGRSVIENRRNDSAHSYTD